MRIDLCNNQCCDDVEHAALVARKVLERTGHDLWFEGKKLMRRGADGAAYQVQSVNMRSLLSRCVEFHCRGKLIDPPPKVITRLLNNCIGMRLFRQVRSTKQKARLAS
jgi:hypothetical protein